MHSLSKSYKIESIIYNQYLLEWQLINSNPQPKKHTNDSVVLVFTWGLLFSAGLSYPLDMVKAANSQIMFWKLYPVSDCSGWPRDQHASVQSASNRANFF